MTTSKTTANGPLRGVKVVACSTAQAGTVPYMLMADLGGGTADLIRLRFNEPSDAGAKVALECVGNGIGEIAHANPVIEYR